MKRMMKYEFLPICIIYITFLICVHCWHHRRCGQYINEKYRTINGHCNNLNHPEWGQTGTPQTRFKDKRGRPMVEFDDDCNVPRGYHQLPNPRIISNQLSNAHGHDIFDYKRTAQHMAWGQFLSHDIVLTPMVSADIDCCNRKDKNSSNIDVCFPMSAPAHDSLPHGCLNFVRSAKAPDNRHRGYRENINKITAFIDASHVYGSDSETESKVRVNKHYLLKTTACNLLPTKEKGCFKTNKCPFGGDPRAQEVPNLTLNHHCYLREHNYISTELHKINPHWSNEKVFQETRRIIIAQMQHITYNHFLPLTLDWHTMRRYGLYSKKRGYENVYDDTVNPSVRNVFGAAAFRYGHSQIVPEQSELESDFKTKKVHLLEDQFFDPSLYQDNCGKKNEGLSRFLATSKACRIDSTVVEGIRSKLFFKNKPPGADLYATNINRGRDQGIPGFNKWRRFCGLKPFRRFRQFGYPAERKLRKLYRSIEDVDLFVGGLLECGNRGSVGPTFSCLIAKQFASLKEGDRYWYETNDYHIAFTEDQLNSIKSNTLLSKIWCRNFGLKKIQKDIFTTPSNRNRIVNCDDLPDIDLSLWKETESKYHYYMNKFWTK